MMKKTLTIILFAMLALPLTASGDECIEGDCQNGYGVMIFSTGHKFSGEFKDGMRHGEGVFILPGGRKIVGVWENNEIKEGTFTAADGTTYTGQWQFREREGQGTMTWPRSTVTRLRQPTICTPHTRCSSRPGASPTRCCRSSGRT